MDSVKSGVVCVCDKMWKYQHIIAFLVMLIFSIRFIPGDNEGLATRPAEEPTSIVSNGSHVYDIYRGNMLLRDVAITDAEMAFVLYYAPWSKDSIDAIREYEAAADVMFKQVTFVAINCWYIKGTCRGKLHFHKFPQVYFHRKNMKNAVYYNGRLEKDYFLHFLEKAIRPVRHISTVVEAEELIYTNQFSAMAAFKHYHLDLAKEFDKYAIVATRVLEYALLQIEFGVSVNAHVASSFAMEPGILYVRDQMKSDRVGEISLKNTTDEVVQYLVALWEDTVCRDLNFRWNRPSFLHDSLKEGPLLVVFLSSPTIAERRRYVQKIRQLAMAYLSSETERNRNYSLIYAKTTASLHKCCGSFIFDKRSPAIVCSVCVWGHHHQSAGSYPNCNFSDLLTRLEPDSMRDRVALSPNKAHCSERPGYYSSSLICCQSLRASNGSALKNAPSKRKTLDDVRHRFSVSRENSLSYTLSGDVRAEPFRTSIIEGLSQAANETLQFVILDVDRHAALARSLGIEESRVYDANGTRLATAILDIGNEKNYVMKSGSYDLEEFVVNYTLGLLPEHLQSGGNAMGCVGTTDEPCVHEITTATFEEAVLNSNKNVLLLYYLPWCSACTSISHNYLYLSDVLYGSSTVHMARIDSNTNKLPLPFRVQTYPAIILYPANRSSYSAVFPGDEEVNLPSLLSFLLKSLSKRHAKLLLLDICIHAKDYPEIRHAACRNYKKIQRERAF